MAKVHTVKQGENFNLIAKQHNIADWRDIYRHAGNAELRQKRPNPNILQPGDQVVIPDLIRPKITVRSGAHHKFVLTGSNQKLQLRIVDHANKPLGGVKTVLTIDGAPKTMTTDKSGQLQVELTKADIQEVALDIYLKPDDKVPSHLFLLKLSHLNPPDTLAGLQARLNSLGHDCGVVDGVFGAKTKAGIESFQRAKNMPVTGKADAEVYKAAQTAYGS